MEPSALGYLPFDDRPFRLRMGLRPLDPDRWLEVDDRRDDELAQKATLLATRHHDVVAFVDHPAVREAATELDGMVRGWLGDHEVEAGDEDRGDAHPIERCGRVTQEDWCLLVDLDATEPVLAAACVCFPTRWVLRDKMGRSTAAVHAPVSGYDEQLAAPVDRFLARLRVDQPMWRLNWNVLDDGELHQPVRLAPDAAGPSTERPALDVGRDVWLRVERQTLRRLPRTGAVAFSIRVHQQPLAGLEADPAVLVRLRGAVDALPEPTFRYKGLHRFAGELRAWIDEVVAQNSLRTFDSTPRNSS